MNIRIYEKQANNDIINPAEKNLYLLTTDKLITGHHAAVQLISKNAKLLALISNRTYNMKDSFTAFY